MLGCDALHAKGGGSACPLAPYHPLFVPITPAILYEKGTSPVNLETRKVPVNRDTPLAVKILSPLPAVAFAIEVMSMLPVRVSEVIRETRVPVA